MKNVIKPLKKYIENVMDAIPKSEVHFDIGLSGCQGELVVDSSSTNRVKFTLVKEDKK